MLRHLLDFRRPDAPARRFRSQRHALFLSLLAQIPRPLRLLDVGGTEDYWRHLGVPAGVEVLALNLDGGPSSTPNVTAEIGDARDLSAFGRGSFDMVFSNSLIEHLSPADQFRAAREIVRVGRAYFVQTPNWWFPLEPHFLLPGFHWLPIGGRAWMLRHVGGAWCGRVRDPERARELAGSVHLLTMRDLQDLFPAAEIWKERAFGLCKSLVAYDVEAFTRPGAPGSPRRTPTAGANRARRSAW